MLDIEVGSSRRIYGLSSEEEGRIKEALTFRNPVYEKVKKFSRWNGTKVPKTLTYFRSRTDSDGCKFIEVPLGFDYHPFTKKQDLSYVSMSRYIPIGNVPYPKFVINLREDQIKAANKYLVENRCISKCNGIIVLPTGKGKTVLALYLASALKVKVLVLVHKDDLVRGWKKDCELCFDGKIETGLIKAKSRKVGKQITIATVQTVSRMKEEELSRYVNEFDMVIMDEVHHAPSTSFLVVGRFNCRYRLGLTATLERADGLSHVIRLYFGGVCYRYEFDENEKDILPVEVIRVHIPTYLDPLFKVEKKPQVINNMGKVVSKSYLMCKLEDRYFHENEKVRSGYARLSELSGELKKIDYAFADLDDDSVSNFETVRRVVGDISKEYAEGHSCIVFFSQKKHLEMYRKQLINHIPESRIGTYYGDNKEDVNNEVLSLAERGKIKVTLSTYSKSREGTNCKSWEVAFLVSSIADGKNVEQAIGRIRRTKEGKISTVRVYDYRYDNVAVLCNQGSKRDARYNKLHFSVKGDSDKGRDIFRRGYKKF